MTVQHSSTIISRKAIRRLIGSWAELGCLRFVLPRGDQLGALAAVVGSMMLVTWWMLVTGKLHSGGGQTAT